MVERHCANLGCELPLVDGDQAATLSLLARGGERGDPLVCPDHAVRQTDHQLRAGVAVDVPDDDVLDVGGNPLSVKRPRNGGKTEAGDA